MRSNIFSKGGKCRSDAQRDYEKETEGEDRGERNNISVQEVPYAAAWDLTYFPDCIQGILELNNDSGGGKEERSQPQQSCEETLTWPAGIRQHGLNGLGAAVSKCVLDRGRDLPAGRLPAEEKSGDGDGDNNNRSERKYGIIGERRALTRVLMFRPVFGSLF